MVRAYARLRIQGSLPQGEVWSINPSFIGNFDTSPPSTAALEDWAQNAADFLQTSTPTNLLGVLSSAATIDSVRAEAYGTDGRLENYAEAPLTASRAGTGTLNCPVITSLVCSLYTGIPGRSFRGRFYWPGLGLGLDADTGRIPITAAATLAGDFNTMLVGLQASAPSTPALVLGVYSKTRGSGTAVTQLRVGDIPDSWRGRRDAVQEAYALSAYTGV